MCRMWSEVRAVREFDFGRVTNRAPLKRAVGSDTDLNILARCFSSSLARRYGNPYTVKIKAVLVSRLYVQFDG
jgi:tRNA pseudouridine-54 N-methylase